MKTIAIIGGGASGIICAIKAAQNPENQIMIFEKNPRILKKLLSTGNGKCNLSNNTITAADYSSEYSSIIEKLLCKFGVDQTLDFFKSIGLLTHVDASGRIYPRSNQATSVVDILRFSVEKDNISILTEYSVEKIAKKGDLFYIYSDKGIYNADYVVVACGGAAAPALGGTRSGIKILSSFGHTIIEQRPSLVQIRTDNTEIRSLKGIKADVNIKIYENSKLKSNINDELLFTDYGLSGPAAFNSSKANCFDDKKINNYAVIDFEYEYSYEEVTAFITEAASRGGLCENLLTGMMNKRIGQMLVKKAGIRLNDSVSTITDADIRKLTEYIKKFRLEIIGTTGFENAQVAAGGAKLNEFSENLESKIIKGLFAAGEVLDVDGLCGGYNLQWAWSSGAIIGGYLQNA